MTTTRRRKQDNTWADYLAYRHGKSDTPAYDDRGYLWLGCRVERIEYHVPTRTGKAYLFPGDCTDGPSVIRFFQQIDPKVRRIETISGGSKDTTYCIDEGGNISTYM